MRTLHLLILLWILASIAALAMPIYDLAYLHPSLTRLLAQSTERDAHRLARATIARLPEAEDGVLVLDRPGLGADLEAIRSDFGLLRISLMNMDGALIQRVAPGFPRGRSDALRQVVTTGRRMVRTVRTQLESPTTSGGLTDIMLLAIPVSRGAYQAGALEIAYDWTEQRADLDALVRRATLFMFALPVLLLGMMGFVSLQAYRAVRGEELSRRELARNRRMLETKHRELADLFQQIEHAKTEWQLSMDCIDDMVLLVDKDGRIRRCNEPFRRLIGTPYTDLLGKKWRDILFTSDMVVVSMAQSSFQLFHKPGEQHLALNFYPYKDRTDNGPDWTVITINVHHEGMTPEEGECSSQ